MHQRLEAILHPGDWGHSNLHELAECIRPEAVRSHVVRAFVAGLRCMGRAVASDLEETAEKVAEGNPETAEWSSVLFDLQKASDTR